MDEVTAGNRRAQLVRSGVWVQVAEISRPDSKFKSEKLREEAPLMPRMNGAPRIVPVRRDLATRQDFTFPISAFTRT